MNNTGQLGGIGHVLVVIFSCVAGLLIYIATYPLYSSIIDTFLASSTDPILNILVSLFPLLFLVGIFIWFLESLGNRYTVN